MKNMDPQNDAHAFSFLIDDTDILECFLNFPDVNPEHPFVLDCSIIVDAQNADATLSQLLQEQPDKHSRQLLGQNISVWFAVLRSLMLHLWCAFWMHHWMRWHIGNARPLHTWMPTDWQRLLVFIFATQVCLLPHCQTVCNTCDPCQCDKSTGSWTWSFAAKRSWCCSLAHGHRWLNWSLGHKNSWSWSQVQRLDCHWSCC